jgi:hypothetical protein
MEANHIIGYDICLLREKMLWALAGENGTDGYKHR